MALIGDGRAAPFRRTVLAVVVGWLGGCNVGPDYVKPEVETPDVWHQTLSAGLVEGETNLHTWWTVLNDPILNDLIDRAIAENKDLKTAFSRVREARAQRGVASGQQFPDIDGTGDIFKTHQSEELAPVIPPGLDRTDNYFQAGIDASWELDFWGRIRRSIESADAGYLASVEDYRDVLVLVLAEVALSYVEVRAAQARIHYAEANVSTQQQTLQLTQDRFDAEIAPELDVRQAELNLASTESIIPSLRILEAQAINRIAVLIGTYPAEIGETLRSPSPIPDLPETVSVGIPADLMRQRPDIRRAERQLASQTARIGVVTADLYPRFALLGTFSLEATQFHNLWSGGAGAFTFGPTMRWNIFDGGRVRNQIGVEDARTEQALNVYEQSVLRALEEVENAIVGYAQENVRREALARSVDAAQRSVELVQTLYRTGLTDFQNVLDMERSLAAQQDQLAASEGFLAQNLVLLYKSLGGGWQPDPEVLTQEIQDAEENGEPIF